MLLLMIEFKSLYIGLEERVELVLIIQLRLMMTMT